MTIWSTIRNLAIRSHWSTRLLVLLAAVSLVSGLLGWSALRPSIGLSLGDVIYRSVAALSLAVPYQSSDLWLHDIRIEIARWAGLGALIIGASKTIVALFSSRWRLERWLARSGHWIIIGDTKIAAHLCSLAVIRDQPVRWLCAPEKEKAQPNPLLLIDHRSWNERVAAHYGIIRAAGVIVAMQDDATTCAVARQARALIRDTPDIRVLASIESPWIAMRMDDIGGLKGVQAISEPQMAVRQIHSRHPPFLLAVRAAQRRIHTLIVGFNRIAEAILIETLLGNLTTDLDTPLFTIVTRNKDKVSRDLGLRYPEITRSAQIRILSVGIDDQSGVETLSAAEIQNVSSGDPFTAVYICSHAQESALSSALSFQALASRLDSCTAPIFVHVHESGTLPTPVAGVSRLQPHQLVGFGINEALTDSSLPFDSLDEELAKIMHEQYRSTARENGLDSVPWEQLSEDKRESNRRQIRHIPAKLHCLGIDVETWLHKRDSQASENLLPSAETRHITDEQIDQVARLEHDRWMADKFINGWIYGRDRDDQARIHPDLIPFDQLEPATQAFDTGVVVQLLHELNK